MEEIDIIELLRRVKEGKAPKEIEINNKIFYFNSSIKDIELLYTNCGNEWLRYKIDFNTKIKILDKPIIEELEINEYPTGDGNCLVKVSDDVDKTKIAIKINEIIEVLNGRNL